MCEKNRIKNQMKKMDSISLLLLIRVLERERRNKTINSIMFGSHMKYSNWIIHVFISATAIAFAVDLRLLADVFAVEKREMQNSGAEM